MSTTQPTTYRMLIGGERVAAESGHLLDSIDPFTGDVWARVPDASAADVDARGRRRPRGVRRPGLGAA